MAYKYFKAILIIAVILVSNLALGQGAPPTPKPDPLPIDGGILALLALGVGYAVKKIRDNSKD